MAGGEEVQRCTLRDYITLGAHSQTLGIMIPPVAAHNFELKLALISMVQQSQFGGLPMEDPNLHLSVFLEVYDTLKINGASTHAIRLCMFPFSLRDKQGRGYTHYLQGRSQHERSSRRPSSPNSSHQARRRVCAIRLRRSPREKTRPCMKHGRDSRIC